MKPSLLFAASVHVEDVLLLLLIQLVVILLTARLFAWLFRKMGQPAVVGEIAAGLLLGPSALGKVPQVKALFHPEVAGLGGDTFYWIFAILAQLGLILLLFLVGLECDFAHLRWHGPAALSISLSGIVVPFALGFGLALLLSTHADLGVHPLSGRAPPPLGFALFLGTALSITALPVLGRILLELNIVRTRLGTLTITGAAVDDALGWILLATVAAVVRSEFDSWNTLMLIATTALFALVMVTLVGPLLRCWMRRQQGDFGPGGLALLLCAVLSCAIVTNRIGIFAIFGAFLLGAVLSGENDFRDRLTAKLRDFVTAFFLPIFFAYTGLRTDIGSLDTWQLWLWCGVVLAAAVLGKFGGCTLAAWRGGLTLREAACIGTLMNARGLMELIVVNVGYDLRVIPPSMYCMLVFMAIVTTFMTTPLLVRLSRGTELEPHIREAGFWSLNGSPPSSLPARERQASESTPRA